MHRQCMYHNIIIIMNVWLYVYVLMSHLMHHTLPLPTPFSSVLNSTSNVFPYFSMIAMGGMFLVYGKYGNDL